MSIRAALNPPKARTVLHRPQPTTGPTQPNQGSLASIPQALPKLSRYLQSSENFERRALGQQMERFQRTKEYLEVWEKAWDLLGH